MKSRLRLISLKSRSWQLTNFKLPIRASHEDRDMVWQGENSLGQLGFVTPDSEEMHHVIGFGELCDHRT
jgi:hypothetical protein